MCLVADGLGLGWVGMDRIRICCSFVKLPWIASEQWRSAWTMGRGVRIRAKWGWRQVVDELRKRRWTMDNVIGQVCSMQCRFRTLEHFVLSRVCMMLCMYVFIMTLDATSACTELSRCAFLTPLLVENFRETLSHDRLAATELNFLILSSASCSFRQKSSGTHGSVSHESR